MSHSKKLKLKVDLSDDLTVSLLGINSKKLEAEIQAHTGTPMPTDSSIMQNKKRWKQPNYHCMNEKYTCWGWRGGPGGKELLAFLQRTRVQFPPPIWWHNLLSPQFQGDLIPPFWPLQVLDAHGALTYRQSSHIHANKWERIFKFTCWHIS